MDVTKPEVFSDELVLTLREPIKVGDIEFAEIKLTEPTGKALRLAAREDTMGGLFVLITHAASVPPMVPEKMRQRDLQRAADFFAHFGEPPSSTPSASTPPN